MKNLLLLILFTACIATSFAKDKKAKIDIVDDTVKVEGKSVFILETIKKPKFEYKDYFLKGLDGKKAALLIAECYDDPTRPNPDRYKYKYASEYLSTCYYSITFLGTKKISDFPIYFKQIRLAEFLVDAELVKDGIITADAEDEFILIHGNRNAEERNEKLGRNTIIINNNSSTPIQKNGINININKEDD